MNCTSPEIGSFKIRQVSPQPHCLAGTPVSLNATFQRKSPTRTPGNPVLKIIPEMKIHQFSDKQSISNSDVTMSSKAHTNHVTFQRTFKVTYLGYAVLDRRYTLPMLPWIIAEIKRYGAHNAEDILLEVTESSLKAVKTDSSQLVFEHKLQSISKFAQTAQDPSCFTYMTREIVHGPCAYHVFQAIDESTVLELFTTMREMTKEMANQQCTITPLSKSASGAALDSIMTSCQHYEVMYVGKIKVSSKRAPPSFIDDAVEKFRIYELEKLKSQSHSSGERHRHGSGSSVSSLPNSLDLVEQPKENELGSQVNRTRPDSKETFSGSSSYSSWENVTSNSSNDISKECYSNCSDSFLQSPMSPLSSFENFKHTSPTHSLVSHTQSMDANSILSLTQDLKDCSSKYTLMPPSSLITHTQSLDAPGCADIMQDLQDMNSDNLYRNRVRSVSGDTPRPSKQTSLPTFRTRVGSGGTVDIQRPRAYTYTSSNSSNNRQRNRTMLFLIGRQEICLIGTDKKQMLLSKMFNDIAHCSQGIRHLDHFGFICREASLTGADCYTGYIFRCQTEKVVDEMMQCLKQAFYKAHQDYQHQIHQRSPQVPKIIVCDGCPMQWFHKLCVEIEGCTTEKMHQVILQRLNTFPDSDKDDIMQKLLVTDVHRIQEENEVLMMLLREFCEHKQLKHDHINGNFKGKNEFDFLKEKSSSSKLDSFRQKAKKSLSNSFETFLKLKGKDEVRPRSVTSISDHMIPHTLVEGAELSDKDGDPFDTPSPHREGSYDGTTESSSNGRLSPFLHRPRSSTFSTTQEARKENKRRSTKHQGKQDSSPHLKSPIMNIFMKVGHQNKTPSSGSREEIESPSLKGSWRQAIFHRVQTPVRPNKELNASELVHKSDDGEILGNESQVHVARTKEQLRALWKKAILEQILLIRMEKENKKLQVSQDAAFSKRMKLDYEAVTPCLKDAAQKWDDLLNNSSRRETPVDRAKLQEMVRAGVPRHKRGEIWSFLAEHHSYWNSQMNNSCEVDLSIPYEELLKQLTSHQHAIIIDLGRTFPNHPFFSQPLGSGQLSLYNLLKGYSLLDKEVGYCQGLSFVAGILLLHMPEDRAFQMMKHILFNLGLRRQYKPDMIAHQIQMYQLSRLLHDNYRDLYDHLERYDIAPTLYATAWFLTLFASQFPLGFVARLFDLVFLQGMDTVLKVALVLLGTHRDLILQRHGFEPIMDFLKTSLTSIGIIQMERIFNQVFTLDVSKQLHAYEVEYHVLREEMMYSPSKGDTEHVQKLEAANRNLKVQNMELMEQLQVAYSTIHQLEASEASHKSTVQRLEIRVRSLEDEKEALVHSLHIMKKRLQVLELANLESQPNSPVENRPPSFGVVYKLAGSEKEEELQLKQLIKEFCEERNQIAKEDHSDEVFEENCVVTGLKPLNDATVSDNMPANNSNGLTQSDVNQTNMIDCKTENNSYNV